MMYDVGPVRKIRTSRSDLALAFTVAFARALDALHGGQVPGPNLALRWPPCNSVILRLGQVDVDPLHWSI